MRPKVLIVIASHIVGGPGKGLFQFLNNAPSNEFDYILCNFDVGINKEEFEFYNEAIAQNINIKLIIQKSRYDTGMLAQVSRLIKDNNINIIQSHGYKGHIIALLLSKLHKIKWLAMVHGWTNENFRIKIYNKLEYILLKYPDAVITVSPLLFDVIKNRRGIKKDTSLVLNAVDKNEIAGGNGSLNIAEKLNISSDDFVIGVIGRLSKEKGQEFLLEALSLCKNECPDLKLLVVGDGPDREILSALSIKLNLENNVIFCGHQKDMKSFYKIINLLVLPSLSEGLPNVVLEAMSMGVPVLSTKVGGVGEIITDRENGWLVKPGDSKELANKIQNLYLNRNTLADYGKVAENSLEPKFCPKRRAEKILDTYFKLLESKQGS